MVADLKYLTPDELKKYYELREAYNALVPKLIEERESDVTEPTQTDKIAYQKLLASYELIEIAEKRELEYYSTDIESMMKGAIIQLHRTAEKIIRNLDEDFVIRWDTFFVISDFEKTIRSSAEPFETYISQYPDYAPKFEEAVKDICKKYPSQMIVIEKEYDMLELKVDFTENELGAPIMETKHAFIYAYQDPHKIWNAIDGEVIFDENTPPEIESCKKQSKNIKRLDAALPKDMIIPLDKINNLFWNKGIPIDGKPHKIGIEKDGAKEKGNIIVIAGIKELLSEAKGKLSIDVNEYDGSVWLALANAAYFNKRELTIPQVYELMGGKTRAKKDERQKIIKSFMKLLDGTIFIDNREETDKKKLGYNYPTYYGKAQLIQGEIIVSDENNAFTMGGQAVDCIIRLGDVPYLFRFAQERKQIATVPLTVLQTPLRLTEKNLRLRDYIIKRICRIKDLTSPCTILIPTICKSCAITDKSSKSRLIATLSKLLNYYKEIGFIKNYRIMGDKITIQRNEQEVIETAPKKGKKK